MMQSYRIVSSDGREFEIVDDVRDGIFPYQEVAQLARRYGFLTYNINLGEMKDD